MTTESQEITLSHYDVGSLAAGITSEAVSILIKACKKANMSEENATQLVLEFEENFQSFTTLFHLHILKLPVPDMIHRIKIAQKMAESSYVEYKVQVQENLSILNPMKDVKREAVLGMIKSLYNTEKKGGENE